MGVEIFGVQNGIPSHVLPRQERGPGPNLEGGRIRVGLRGRRMGRGQGRKAGEEQRLKSVSVHSAQADITFQHNPKAKYKQSRRCDTHTGPQRKRRRNRRSGAGSAEEAAAPPGLLAGIMLFTISASCSSKSASRTLPALGASTKIWLCSTLLVHEKACIHQSLSSCCTKMDASESCLCCSGSRMVFERWHTALPTFSCLKQVACQAAFATPFGGRHVK